jgi:hypothetical protein
MKRYLKLLHIKHLKVQKPTNYLTVQTDVLFLHN